MAVVKLLAVAGAAIAGEQAVERGMRAAGASEQTVRGFRLAAAIVALILFRRRSWGGAAERPPSIAAEPPAPKISARVTPRTTRPEGAKGPLNNRSGDLDESARLARTQPHGPPLTAKLPESVESSVPHSYVDTKHVIDMTIAPAGRGLNAAGFPRNAPWFWRQLLKQQPQLFSDANKAAIRSGRSPAVDNTWIQHNPMHQAFKGDKLIHHHIEQGATASGLPETIHNEWNLRLHPDR